MTATAPALAIPATRWHRPELDALRFGAWALVFLCHALPYRNIWRQMGVDGWPATLLVGIKDAGGWGVDLFFLLSAYLITEVMLREVRKSGTVRVWRFLARRALRIWPLYFVALAAAIWLVPLVLPQSFPTESRIAFGIFGGNWAGAWGWPITSVASILWSVSIEEQFYLTWAIALRFFLRQLKAICVGLIVVAWGTRIYLYINGATHHEVWMNTFARLDPIAVGALIALHLEGTMPRIARRLRVAMIACGPVLLVASGIWLDTRGRQTIAAYPVATLASALMLLGCLGGPWRVPEWLGWLGKVSYGLYVFHAFAIMLSRAYVAPELPLVAQWIVQPVAALGITVGLAAVSWRWLERPALRWKDRIG